MLARIYHALLNVYWYTTSDPGVYVNSWGEEIGGRKWRFLQRSLWRCEACSPCFALRGQRVAPLAVPSKGETKKIATHVGAP